ncbi:MAG: NAD-dependent epimerase/dehydratase family protein [Gammaproteobacteria bacterium]
MAEIPARHRRDLPLVLVTGASGEIGSALVKALVPDYRVVGLDRVPGAGMDESCVVDITAEDSLATALRRIRAQHGRRVASVLHLAAYFDFTGDDDPRYRTVNVEGSRRLLRLLAEFDVEQFIYSGTMLVHAPCMPGERIDESREISPRWSYPESKAAAEAAIREGRGRIPVVFLHLAGYYDEMIANPVLAHQIARVYERDLTSHLYSGNTDTGQSVLHRDDMIDAFRRAIERRSRLPDEVTILIGEAEPMSYRDLQNGLGRLIHGEQTWQTLTMPKPLAAAGAWLEDRLEAVIPDRIDAGKKPFIQPFMIGMSDDHYALDIRRARNLLGWEPRHRISTTLPRIVGALRDDPVGWYRANHMTPPHGDND